MLGSLPSALSIRSGSSLALCAWCKTRLPSAFNPACWQQPFSPGSCGYLFLPTAPWLATTTLAAPRYLSTSYARLLHSNLGRPLGKGSGLDDQVLPVWHLAGPSPGAPTCFACMGHGTLIHPIVPLRLKLIPSHTVLLVTQLTLVGPDREQPMLRMAVQFWSSLSILSE